MSNFEKLIERFAEGRQICNCRKAYYTPCGHGIDRDGSYSTTMNVCKHGCSSAQIEATEYIAKKVIELLDDKEQK